MTEDRRLLGVARYVGAIPADTPGLARVFDVGDIELYQVAPPLAGYHVVAAATSLWAMRAMLAGDDGPVDDPVETTLFGVDGGEAVRVDRDRELCEPFGGRTPARALAELGYALR